MAGFGISISAQNRNDKRRKINASNQPCNVMVSLASVLISGESFS